jgi:membrane protein DedA with SNARE-associated domain
MPRIFDWLLSLPLAALYVALAGAAALENIFPPVPADTIVAIGSFLAARGEGSVLWAFAATWAGNVGGAMLMYALGRKYGAERLERRMLGEKGPRAEARLHALYGRYGIGALFVSRFIPGVRALVPPFAGALRIPPVRAAIAMGVASGLWYGVVSYVGFRAGANWQQISAVLGAYGRSIAIGAGAIILVGLGVWWIRSRSAR